MLKLEYSSSGALVTYNDQVLGRIRSFHADQEGLKVELATTMDKEITRNMWDTWAQITSEIPGIKVSFV